MKLNAETTLKGIAIAMGAIAALMAVSELQRGLKVDAAHQSAVVAEDPLRQTLQRCRTLTPEKLEVDTECQTAWAENRRLFFSIPSNDLGAE